ncbi:hypothetical protein CL620_02400 [archaeon]|jgi:4-hydroxybenzoate polyprenyltransferase|nr:hypothetical protein [archaeon]
MSFDWSEEWVEAFTVILLLIGFIIAIALKNPFLSYVLIFLAGMLAARGYYLRRKNEPILPFVLLILGFLLGYILGAFSGNRMLTFLFFAVGFFVSYYLHVKKIITIFKSKGYVK